MGGIFTIREAHCAAIANVSQRLTWYALVMDDKKKTHEDVEVEDRDSFASSAGNGGVRGKNGLHFVCWSCVHVPTWATRISTVSFLSSSSTAKRLTWLPPSTTLLARKPSPARKCHEKQYRSVHGACHTASRSLTVSLVTEIARASFPIDAHRKTWSAC